MLTAAASMQRSSRRPVPIIGRADLVVSEVRFRGITHGVVKDPVGMKYHRLRAEQIRLLELLDGHRTLESLRETLVHEFPAIRPTLRELQRLIADLHEKGLAYSARPGQTATRSRQEREQRYKQWRQSALNLLSLRLPGWDPDAVLRGMLPWTSWLFQPIGVALCLAFVVSSWITLGLHAGEIQRKLPAFEQFFGWPNLIYLWITLACAKIIHEFGHGLSCRYFGGECHEMGVMLLVFSPCLYCDVTDSWMLRNKWQRIIIGGAGMWVEVILSAIAIYVWQATSSGLLHYLSLNLFFVTTVTTVFFNANPLMQFDGYYMLSDWLEIPNLRPQAEQFVRTTASKTCLGIETPPDPFAPQTGRVWFILFAVASKVYGWFVLANILMLLYVILKPYGLQSLGQAMAWFSVGMVLGGGIMQVYQVYKAPRAKPISRVRLGVTLTMLGLLVAGVLQIRVPWYRTAVCHVEPRDVRSVMTETAGEVAEVLVSPGDYVAVDDVLVRLTDPDLNQRLQEIQTQVKVQELELRVQGAIDDMAAYTVVKEILDGLRAQEAELSDRQRHLTVRAPCAGQVVAASRTPSATLESQDLRLPSWHGTPLDPRNGTAFLPVRTELLQIAPHAVPETPLRYETVVYLDQSQRLDVRERMKLRIKFDHWPQETFTGHVRQIATGHTEIAPATLSNKQGGGMATVTDKEGREKLEQPVYQALVEFDQSPPVLRTGLRGQARFVVMERTLGMWLWRSFRQTFDFEM